MTTSSPTTTTTTGRPGTVDGAFWLYLVAPIVGLVLGLVNLGTSVSAASATAANAGVGHGAVVAAVVIGLVIDVVYLVAFIVIDVFFRRGVRWARIGLVVLTVLALLGFSEGSFVLGALRFVLAAAGTVLLFTPPARAVFARDAGRTFSR